MSTSKTPSRSSAAGSMLMGLAVASANNSSHFSRLHVHSVPTTRAVMTPWGWSELRMLTSLVSSSSIHTARSASARAP